MKAFDTANHELLIALLKKFGAPQALCDVVERMYTDLQIMLKFGDKKYDFFQEVGVRQGDDMAPVLFLFLMAAFEELVDKAWERENMERIELMRESDDTFHKGQLLRHDIKRCESPPLSSSFTSS